MAKFELALPAMGEGIIEATITRWLVKEGDKVTEDQPLLEIATDKVDSEIPSPVNGIISKILMDEGEVPAVGSLLAEIETDEQDDRQESKEVLNEAERIKAPSRHKSPPAETSGIPRRTPSGKFLTPLVRSIAHKENLSVEELDKINGSGEAGRITREDILEYMEKGPGHEKKDADKKIKGSVSEGAPEQMKSDQPTEKKMPEYHVQQHSSPAPGEGDKLVEMDRMRRLIAGHMIDSKKTSPHVTSFIDADVTQIVKWREKIREEFRKRENEKITYTPVFIEAASKALRDYPMVNVSLDGTTIIVKKNINIGMAVALADGNLIVPVIKNADEKSLRGLVKSLNDLANRARINKLLPDEIKGGTFTITNFGTFGNTTGTPIINQPEAAILGAGAIIKKPVVIESAQGDVIAIRHIMTLSLSYDHRIIDGALGGMFLKRIAEYLESFDPERKI